MKNEEKIEICSRYRIIRLSTGGHKKYKVQKMFLFLTIFPIWLDQNCRAFLSTKYNLIYFDHPIYWFTTEQDARSFIEYLKFTKKSKKVVYYE